MRISSFAVALGVCGFGFAQTGIISTYAGDGTSGYSGNGGAATSATLSYPSAVATDANGNLFIADLGNAVIRRVDAVTGVITTVAGGGSGEDGGPATSAMLWGPCGVALDAAGDIFISDSCTQVAGPQGPAYTVANDIRMVSAATGIISTIAGGVNPTALNSRGMSPKSFR